MNSAYRLSVTWITGMVLVAVAVPGARGERRDAGPALSVTANENGARLHCAYQRIEGEVTAAGLRLTSTAEGEEGGRLALKADAVGRQNGLVRLPDAGAVSVDGAIARWTRPGLVEEFGVGMDGIRQDFVLTTRPAGEGELRLDLALEGARAEPAPDGARLRLDGPNRELAYTRLRVTDAAGRALEARLEVLSPARLAVRVDDAGADYPIRVDPTFSDADWVSMGGLPGANGGVLALAVDTNSGTLYAGGEFTIMGTVFANRVARWNGSAWSALGSGLNEYVYALAVDGAGHLYAGGVFTTAGGVSAKGVAKWNGSAWSALGAGLSGGEVDSLLVDGSTLYAGGSFTNAGGTAVFHIARWNGSAWSALGAGLGTYSSHHVTALAKDGSGNLVAGGYFTNAGTLAVNYIARWDGSVWVPLGTGMNGGVRALTMHAGQLYAGGSFGTAGGVAARNIARWDGSAWNALGAGVGWDGNEPAQALASDGAGNLYVGGQFSWAGGTNANRIARWDGSAWHTLGSGIGYDPSGDDVYALAVDTSGTVFAGGTFTVAGDRGANYIARWSGGAWSTLGPGMNGTVYALADGGAGTLYAGGEFTTAGSVVANRVARWTGSAWTNLGAGMDNTVKTLLVDGGNGHLYAGGVFTNIGSLAAYHVAKWDGAAWAALGSGIRGDHSYYVSALALGAGGALYAGGYFTNAGGNTASNIAAWNGTAWSPLGAGIGGVIPQSYVHALAVDTGGTLYVGGQFWMAGGTSAKNIARWDGSSWSNMTNGLGSGGGGEAVYALAFDSAGTLYAGGSFDGGPSLFAKWDGTNWIDLGFSGMNGGYIHALAADGAGAVYVGGSFTQANWSTANRIAKWDGAAWSTLGSGMGKRVEDYPAYGSYIYALVLDGAGTLYAGGDFAEAGGKLSAYLAKALLSRPAMSVLGVNGAAIASGAAPDRTKGTDFPARTLGTAVTNWLKITNSALGTVLTISGVSTSGAGQAAFRLTKPPAAVTGGSASNLGVIFAPGAAGVFTCTVSIANDSGTNPYRLCLAGTGLKKAQAINFAAIPDQIVTATLPLSALASSGLPVAFSVVSGPASLSYHNTLAFRGTGTVTVAADQAGNATWAVAPTVRRSFQVKPVPAATAGTLGGDFDGDGKADPAMYDEQSGSWFVLLSGSGYARLSLSGLLGGPGWLAAPADYDGDRLTDPAVYQGGTGDWKLMPSAGGYALLHRRAFLDALGGKPSPGDYDGDAKADYCLYQERDGTWKLKLSSGGYAPLTLPGFLGGSGKSAAAADYDGDRLADPAVYTRADGSWQILLSSGGYAPLTLPRLLGGLGWNPVPGDYDGDGKADPAVRQDGGRLWRILLSGSGYALVEVPLGL